MRLSNQFLYGKHRNRTIADVWCGQSAFNRVSVLEEYIRELTQFMIDGVPLGGKIHLPLVDLNTCTDQIQYFNTNTISATLDVTDSTIFINGKEIDSTYLDHIYSYINKIVTKSYQRNVHLMQSHPEYSINSFRLTQLQAEPDYIAWMIDNSDKFYIDHAELLLLQNKPCSYLNHFTISRSGLNTIKYSPVFNSSFYTLTKSTVSLNKFKFGRAETDRMLKSMLHYEEQDDFCGRCQESPCMCSDQW